MDASASNPCSCKARIPQVANTGTRESSEHDEEMVVVVQDGGTRKTLGKQVPCFRVEQSIRQASGTIGSSPFHD